LESTVIGIVAGIDTSIGKTKPRSNLTIMKPRRFALALIMSGLGLSSQLLAAPTINTDPANSTITIGQNTSFTVAATTSGGTLLYQWQGSSDGGTTWGNISGAPFGNVTTPTLNVNAPAYGFSLGKVRCQVTDDNGTTPSAAATLTINAPAPALILANPTNRSAFQGDVGTADFTVVATGTSLTYQWQVSDNNGAFANLADNAVYSGSTSSATLSIADPYANLGGITALSGHTYRYRCQVTSGGSYTMNSRNAALSIYATPTYTAAVILKVNGSTASTIEASLANLSVPITVQVSGVPSGGTVRVNRFADLNGNLAIDAGEPLVQSFTVTDGAVTAYGGVTDPNIPGDADLTADGTINANFTLAQAAELARGAGNYIFRVVSPTGAFRSVDSSVFTITSPTLAYTVSGTVNVPYAQVALLQQGVNGEDFVSGAVADGSGNYTLPANAGSYMVMALAPGYVTDMATAPTPTVTTASIPGANITLAAADYMNTVTLNDSSSGSGLRGVQIFFESKSTGKITIASTDNNGVAAAPATASASWTADISSQGLASLGYVRPQSNNGISLNATVMGIPLQAANALLYGTLTDNAGTPNPLANVSVNTGDQNNTYSIDTTTDATGHYYLAVYGTGSYWSVNADSQNPIFGTSYSVPQSQSTAVVASTAYNLDLVAPAVTAHLSGTVTNADNSNNPVSGVQVSLYSVGAMNTNFVTSVTTDASGAFSFGVTAGSWQIGLDGDSAGMNNLVGPVLSYPTVTDGNDVTGIILSVRNGTGTISGTVTDFNGVPLGNTNVAGSVTIASVTYAAGTQTNASGQYSFPVINGSWTVNAYSNLMFTQQVVTVGGATTTINFSPTVYFYGPSDQSGVTHGTSASFNAGVNAPGGGALQWEVSTDGGSTWGNVPDVAPYGGVTTSTLNISPATVDLNGYKYRLAVGFTYNSQPHTEYSTAATLTVTGSVPGIIGQPQPQTITASGGTNFSVSASGTPAPSYQWQISTDGGANFTNLGDGGYYSGTQTNTLNISNAPTTLSGYQFKCVVSNGVGSDAVSDAAALTVNAQSQTITFNGGALSLNTPVALSASATSGLSAFNFSVQTATTSYDLTGGSLTITGNGSVTVRATQPGNEYYASAFQDATFTVGTSFASWAQSKFTSTELLDANISGPNAVYGQDGLTNLVKYALGLEPKQNITTGLPTTSTTATDWVYTYLRPDSITDVTYTVQYSTNLSTWTDVTDSFVSNSGGFDTRQATYPLASATNIYFRLKVTQP